MRNICKMLSVVALAIFFLSACSDGSAPTSNEAPASENPAFAIGAVEDDAGGTLLSIEKDALGKAFLLQGSIALQKNYGGNVSNPTSEALKSRVVIFQEEGERLLMLDAARNIQPGQELEPHILITSFPIEVKNEKMISFDFNRGMKNLVLSFDWYVSDFQGNVINPDYVLPVIDSYLRTTKTSPDAITVAQTLTTKDGGFAVPIEVTYYLTLYAENPKYTPVESPGFRYLGYFESNPIVQAEFGDAFANISRWDISKPVTYYISSAMPEKYREAAKQGVLYWNKAFGREVVLADIAPEGLTAPDFEHNIIQWHTHQSTGARADAQMDPLTGEILHAQVFFSSRFTEWSGAYELPKIDRKPEDGKAEIVSLAAKEIDEASLCNLNPGDMMEDLFRVRDLVHALPPERIDALTKDILRWVVAHEVGHTLGLRHNFAASTVNEWTGEKEESIFRQYMKDGTLPDGAAPPANSVMEYSVLAEYVIGGAIIGNPEAGALAHDLYAIQWGYFNNGEKPKYEGHPFCADSGLGYFDDCRQRDSGKHFLERNAYNAVQNLKRLPWLVSEAYLAAKLNFNPRYRRPVTEATPPVAYIASAVAGPWNNLISFLTRRLNLLSILLEYPDFNAIDADEIANETLAWLNGEIAFAGGIEKAFALIDPDAYEKTFKEFPGEFDKIIASDKFRKAPLPEGGTVEFTEEEISYMRGRVKELFAEAKGRLAGAIITTLQGRGLVIQYNDIVNPDSGVLKPIEEVEKAEELEAKWAGYIITSGTGLDFTYSVELRKQAAGFLRSQGPLPEWMASFVPPIAEKLRTQLEAGFGMPIEQIDPANFPRDERKRVNDELGIYFMLAGNDVPAPIPVPVNAGEGE